MSTLRQVVRLRRAVYVYTKLFGATIEYQKGFELHNQPLAEKIKEEMGVVSDEDITAHRGRELGPQAEALFRELHRWLVQDPIWANAKFLDDPETK